MRTFLTGPYLSLMNAFTHHSDVRVEEICNSGFYVPDSPHLFKEYCTLRLDGGRQSGKSTAVTNFAANWLYDGGTVIVLSNTSAYAKISAGRISRRVFPPGACKIVENDSGRDKPCKQNGW